MPSDPRQDAIDAAVALSGIAHRLVPGIRHDFGLAAIEDLDAHPAAKAALAAWLATETPDTTGLRDFIDEWPYPGDAEGARRILDAYLAATPEFLQCQVTDTNRSISKFDLCRWWCQCGCPLP